jgi:VanZ family protein
MSARIAVARAAAVVWLAVLTWGSLAPEESVQGAFTFGDVLAHIAGYLGLTLLFLASQRRPRLLLTGAITMGIGILMELLQMLTSDRSGSLLDVASNAAGVLIALGAWWSGSRLTS